MKKALLIILALVLALAVLTGCSSKDENTATTAPVATENVTATPTAEVTAEPTTEPTVESTTEPTAEVTAEPTAEAVVPEAEATEAPVVAVVETEIPAVEESVIINATMRLANRTGSAMTGFYLVDEKGNTGENLLLGGGNISDGMIRTWNQTFTYEQGHVWTIKVELENGNTYTYENVDFSTCSDPADLFIQITLNAETGTMDFSVESPAK